MVNLLGYHFVDNVYTEAQIAEHFDLLNTTKPAVINILGGAQYKEALAFAKRAKQAFPEMRVIFRHYKDGGDNGMWTRLSASDWWAKIGSLYVGTGLTILTDNESTADDMTEQQIAALAAEIAKAIYDGLTDQETADALNALDKTADTQYLSGPDIGALVDVGEFKTLTDDATLKTLYAIWAMPSVPVASGFYRDYLLDTFDKLPITLSAIQNALAYPTSFAEQFGIRSMGMRKIGPYHVGLARKYNATGVIYDPPDTTRRDPGQATAALNVTLPDDIATLINADKDAQAKSESDGVWLPLDAIKTLLLRYAGAFLVIFGVGYFLWKRQIRHSVEFALVPTLAMLPWMLRNLALVGSPFGYREGARFTPRDNLVSLAFTLALLSALVGVPMGVSWFVSRLLSLLSCSRRS